MLSGQYAQVKDMKLRIQTEDNVGSLSGGGFLMIRQNSDQSVCFAAPRTVFYIFAVTTLLTI